MNLINVLVLVIIILSILLIIAIGIIIALIKSNNHSRQQLSWYNRSSR